MTIDETGTILERAVLWRNVWQRGSEYAALWRTAEGWLLDGTATCALNDQQPMLVTYAVVCDLQWRTRRVELARVIGRDTRRLVLEASGTGDWQRAGEPVSAVRGCIDVDLSVSPITNTLPIRRLDLAVGSRAAVTAAWIRLPDLTIEPLSQTYARSSPERYAYHSSTGFSTAIEVDELGLVVTYPPAWERVAVAR